MSYDLAFWEGQPPASDAAASAIYAEIMDGLEEFDGLDDLEPPTLAIQSLIDALERRWPPFDDHSPWASAPLGGEDAHGGTLYVNLVPSVDTSVVDAIVETARELGVVTYDPQVEAVL